MIRNIKFILLLLSQLLIAQNSILFKNYVVFNETSIEFGKKYVSSQNDTIVFETIKFYLSDIILKTDGNQIVLQKHKLVNLEDEQSLQFISNDFDSEKTINSVSFSIGIDSLTNVSGANADDLDVTNGMYWSWQSGYINIKLEGTSSSCKTRKNKFQFHIGGYLDPNNCLRSIKLPIANNLNKKEITIIYDFAKLFSKINLKDNNTIMSPNKKAMEFSDLFSQIITAK